MTFPGFHKTFERLPIARQLLLQWVAWISVASILLSGSAALMMKRQLNNELLTRATEEAGNRLDLVDMHLRSLEEEVLRLARHSFSQPHRRKELQRALMADLMLHRETRGLMFLDHSGQVVQTIRPESLNPPERKDPAAEDIHTVLHKGQILRRLEAARGDYILIVPIKNGETIIGAVAAFFDFTVVLQQFFQRRTTLLYAFEQGGHNFFQTGDFVGGQALPYQTSMMRELDISCRYGANDPEFLRPLHDASILLLIISLALVVITIAFCVGLAHRITEPLRKMTETLGGAGDGSEQDGNEVDELRKAIQRHQETTQGTLRELEKSRDEALKATQTKSEFLANMSHEVRAPMNGVLGMAQLMRFTDMTPEQRKYVDAIVDAGDSLMGIINDILDFSKIEAGHFQIDYQDFDLRRCLQSTLQIFEVRAKEKGLDLILDMKDDLPRMMRGDDLRLRQILNNLISNAIKFTSQGRVVVHVQAQPQADEKFNLSIQVQDTGIGIHKEDMGRLFKSFSQANSSITRKFGGTGLGLAISQALCEMMGGSIGVDSSPGKGSTFYFNLIFEKAQSEGGEVKENGTEYSRNLRILVADDSDVNQMIIRTMFKKLGIRVDIAADGLEAIEMAAATAYDLIYMDVHMPAKDGPEATRIILSENRFQPPPRVIALTADMFKDDHRQCFEAGMIDLLMKPVQLHDLRLSLLKHGHRAREDRKPLGQAS
ncbi:MAG TPA: ATP-binding protein [Oligoflexus sp.]|uniref:hybrid sensor histidine kinase/response regulator n=1 Tax=Oligoflexus sp. TaxID=1971216 RepID=UPI002D7ED867|nr:ATP-binding protein [Oligoflexus sp.]HET9236195.1 ATP-binding protein [Oligoflexus sp.]